MLITLADESKTVQSSISKVGVSTKPARSLEKFTEGCGDQRPSRCGKLLRHCGESLVRTFEQVRYIWFI